MSTIKTALEFQQEDRQAQQPKWLGEENYENFDPLDLSAITIPHGWSPRPYQEDAWNYFDNGGKRGLAVWHRRAGKDLLCINLCAKKSVERIGLYWHGFPTYSQGRKIAWEGMTKDGRKFLDHFPAESIERKRDDTMTIDFKWGSRYQVVGFDDPDRLVGANPVGVIFSEWSLCNKAVWNFIQPILAENGGWAFFIFTPRGHNHAHEMYQNALKDPLWFVQVLGVKDTYYYKKTDRVRDERPVYVSRPVVTEEDIAQAVKEGMPEDLVDQEFHVSFDAPIVGSYYGRLMKLALDQGRLGNYPFDPRLPVWTHWDIGIGDQTSIWFTQFHFTEIRIIDYLANSGEGLPYYIRKLREKADELGYMYEGHNAPHDIEVREFTNGKSRLETARNLGLRFKVIPRGDVPTGIDAVRAILPRCYFNLDTCGKGIEALRQYKKAWNEEADCFSDSPLHDWCSHPADAFRTMAMGMRIRPVQKNRPQQADGDYKIFGE